MLWRAWDANIGLPHKEEISEVAACRAKGGRALFRELMQVPNLLTLSRILVSPLVLVAFDSLPFLLALGIFAAVTDFLDGLIARSLHQSTGIGVALDPIADKMFVLFFLIAALWRGMLWPWMIVALVLRDAFVAVAIPLFLWLFRGRVDMEKIRTRFKARLAGKIVTSIQFLCVVSFVLTPRATWLQTHEVMHWLHLPFLLLYPASVWAILDYAWYQVALVKEQSASS
ncbi:MAG: CDP-alcohol phosphatidyltransferase family protein [Myxococcales bacterium]|nr:CDP-alcohol phosphatidyltransferase family protein [Myxococcales bacterium]MCB9641549.1 CDP-alcohol phosphatidyltransferase family protein [Myxococcales bacterium]